MRNNLTSGPIKEGATIDTSGAVDLITLGSGLLLTGSVLSTTGGAAGNFIIDGGSASTTYPSNSFVIDFGASS